VYHSGGQEKASSILWMTPSEHVAVNMLCNSEGKGSIVTLAGSLSLMVEP
jgi:hypothetical protein